MKSALEKILNLAKKTGDNVIVYNPAKPDDSYVILALNSYERLVENIDDGGFLTEDYLDDKINGAIEPWDDDWEETENSWEEEAESFLPEDIFGNNEDQTKDEEGEWEEEVNYLYPTEEEFAAMANTDLAKSDLAKDEAVEEEAPQEVAGNFNSVADILGNQNNHHWGEPQINNNF